MEESKEQGRVSLHIVMLPWLAIGHLRPFFQLSKYLARKGHRVSFISTPRNLERVVKVPQRLSHLINLISFPLPQVEHLPTEAESSMDVPHVKQQLLKVAFDLLEPSVRSFLESTRPKPDWIVYDYASHWLPPIAKEMGISRAFFSLFTAASMAFFGPPSVLMGQHGRSTAEDFTIVPEWVPLPSNMAYRLHEMTKNMEKDADGNEYDSGASDLIRFGLTIDGSDITIFRSCIEFEPEWFELVQKLYQKPVIPVGVLHMADEEDDMEEDNNEWLMIKDWLDSKTPNSIVYVALGTEATLSHNETHELALGLEQCGLPFFWVLNRSYRLDMLPNGFLERVRDQGIVYTKWAPQIKILSHPSVGGFLTHCGWNSVTEALTFGRVLILFPLMNDQGLNARLLEKKKVGVEIARNERDGSFTSESVAETLRLALVDAEGRTMRTNARRVKELFGDSTRSSHYVDNLVRYMVKARESQSHDG